MSVQTNTLVSRIPTNEAQLRLRRQLRHYPVLPIAKRYISDIYNIATGAYSPLRGFLRSDDFKATVASMRLHGGALWPMPIVLPITRSDVRQLQQARSIVLAGLQHKPVAVLTDPDIYSYDKSALADHVFGTTDTTHPAVYRIMQQPPYLIGGDIWMLEKPSMPEYALTPHQTRELFAAKNWKTIAGFQTRNIPHRSHEYLHQQALAHVDALFIQPVVGQKKRDDFSDSAIVQSYRLLLQTPFYQTRAIFGVLPTAMHYAGPREAVFHALIRKNFGCTHFIVGRDHAGVGNFYQPYGAHQLLAGLDPHELGIRILAYTNVVHCRSCQGAVETINCPHTTDTHTQLSATRLRTLLKQQKKIPEYFIRGDIYQALQEHSNPFVL